MLGSYCAIGMVVGNTDNNFEHVHFETADELIGALTPKCDLETKTATPKFIFRGHGDIEWELKPKALRLEKAGGLTEALANVEPMLPMTADNQVLAEFLLLHNFVEACDRAVVALPGDGHEFREQWLTYDRGRMAEFLTRPSLWPYNQQLALLAFAQHYGTPTRLLDWTRSGVVAAYFAAEASWRLKIERPLAIWALNIESAHLYKRLEIVNMPGANSVRLGGQRGLFTCVRLRSDHGNQIDDSSLDSALISPNEDRSKPSPLWRLTLPSNECLRLLYLCHLNGVDASTVFPDPAGAAASALERVAWLRRDPKTGNSASEVRPLASVRTRSQRVRE